MNKSERVLSALRGDPVDRAPVSLWFHFGLEREPPEVVAGTELDLFHTFDLDWLKVMHDYPFGDADSFGSVARPADFARIRPVPPRGGGFGKQLEALRRIGDGLAGHALFVDTVLGPWSIAEQYCGFKLAQFFEADRAAVLAGLSVIAESLAGYVPAALECGASGVYYAADPTGLGAQRYEEHVAPLDRRVLQACAAARFNILHVHGAPIRLEPFADYPVAALSFGLGQGQPSIEDARACFAGALVTGVDERDTMTRGTPTEIERVVHASLDAAGSHGLLVAPGCSLQPGTSEAQMRALRSAVDSYRRDG